MNRKDLCTCKFCLPKCQKYVKYNRNRHVCFDEKNINKSLSQSKHCLKQQIIKNKIIKKIKNHHTATHNNFDANEPYFVDALRNFFKSPLKETSESWKKRNLSVECRQFRTSGLNKISEESLLKKVFDENKINELFVEVTESISTSVKFHTKLASKIPNKTKEYLKIKKMKSNEQIIKLLQKDLPSYKKKIESSNKRNPYEFIAKWYRHGYEQKYKNLKSFSKVFDNIDDLETTKKFCVWLRNHPEIEPPPYLLENGLIEKSKFTETSSTLSIDVARRLSRKTDSFKDLDINDDFIRNHFKKYKVLSDMQSKVTKSMSDTLILSDIDIIV